MPLPGEDEDEYVCWFCKRDQCGRCRDETCVCCAGCAA